ncbi:MAG TPA: glycosyltransferase family 4 protein [Cellvibrionaceae bacterium]
MNIEIISFTGDSGLADYAVSLARALKPHAQVTVVTAQSLPAHFDTMGFSIERVFRRSRHFPIDIIKCIKGIISRKPDWVIFQGPLKFAGFDALIVYLLRSFGIRCTITVHDVLPHYPKSWSRAEYGFYYRAFDKVIAHSQTAAQALVAMGIKALILVVPHGIYDIFNLTHLSQEAARLKFPSINATDTLVLFFGNLESRKGLWEFIETAKILLKQRGIDEPHAFKFLLAGAPHLSNSGEDATERLEHAKNLSNIVVHDKRIEFTAVEQYFAAADIIALPYLEGTTSGVLKLALAFGKPVIASNVGDFPEQVPTGGGIFINPNNLTLELTEALITMRQNLHQYREAMQRGNNNAQWPEIALQVIAHLKARR